MLKYHFSFCMMFLACLAASSAWAGSDTVLVINSYHKEYSWAAEHNEALAEGLGDGVDIEYVYMDTKRLPPDRHQESVALALKAFESVHPDVVVLCDDFALKTLGKRITLAGTPVVYLGINNNPRAYFNDMRLVTGVLERPLLKRSIIYIQRLLGEDVDNCLVLFDDGLTAHAMLDTVFHKQERVNISNIATSIKLLRSFAAWKATVLSLKDEGYDVMVLGLYQSLVDDEGQSVPEDEVARWISIHSPVPVFAFWDFTVGKGKAIGGLVLEGRIQGETAASLVRKVLSGEKPDMLPPITPEQGRFMFSRSELARWGLPLPMDFARGGETVTVLD